MSHEHVDLNLLVALDVLLADGSVTGAARRLGLSASAMSRTLARLRAATGDPLLVRAGRGLVPTPRAAELRDRVHELTRDVQAVLRPQIAQVDVGSLDTDVHRSRERSLPGNAVRPRRNGAYASGAAHPPPLCARDPTRTRDRSGKGSSIWKSACLEPRRRRSAPNSCSATS